MCAEDWLWFLVVKPDKKIFKQMFCGKDRADLNAMIRAGLNLDECTLPDEDIEITEENKHMTFAEICQNYHGPHTPQRILRIVERDDSRLVVDWSKSNREHKRLLASKERERLRKQKAQERSQKKQAAKAAAKAERAPYEAEVAKIQQMAEVEVAKQTSEIEEKVRKQKLLAMPEKDKCERTKIRVMHNVHQDILKRNGCDRCIGGKPCKRCKKKKMFQTDISDEEKAKRAARQRAEAKCAARMRSDSADSADSCSTEEALAEEMDKLLLEIEQCVFVCV